MANTVTNSDSTSTPAITKPGVLRGPPRKLLQSSHALWVGNLPSSTDIMKLKEHISTAAMTTIDSFFWISKSNSAFVNYKTADALLDAMTRFHDSTFEGVRLVCRVRRTGSSSPIPSATTIRPVNDQIGGLSLGVKTSVATATGERTPYESPRASEVTRKLPLENHAKERFFIMKSLATATEELESSVQSGQWVAQEHNETTLNQAFAVWDDRSIAMCIYLT